MQKKLDMKLIARAKAVHEGNDALAAMWCGEFDVTQEESIYRDLDDV